MLDKYKNSINMIIKLLKAETWDWMAYKEVPFGSQFWGCPPTISTLFPWGKEPSSHGGATLPWDPNTFQHWHIEDQASTGVMAGTNQRHSKPCKQPENHDRLHARKLRGTADAPSRTVIATRMWDVPVSAQAKISASHSRACKSSWSWETDITDIPRLVHRHGFYSGVCCDQWRCVLWSIGQEQRHNSNIHSWNTKKSTLDQYWLKTKEGSEVRICF